MKWYLTFLIQTLVIANTSAQADDRSCTKVGRVNKISGLFYGYRPKHANEETFLESVYIYDGEQLLRLKTHHPYGEESFIIHLRAYIDRTIQKDFTVFDQNYDKFYADEGIVTATKNRSFIDLKISQIRYGLKTSFDPKNFPFYYVTFEIEDPQFTPDEFRQAYYSPVAYLFLRQGLENYVTRLRFDPVDQIKDALTAAVANLNRTSPRRIKKFPIAMADFPLPQRKPDFFIPYAYRLFEGPHSFGLFRDGRHRIFKNFPDGHRLRLLEDGEIIPKIEIFECAQASYA